MAQSMIQVRMLGGFSLQRGKQTVGDDNGWSKKVWLLAAYLVWNRDRWIPMDEITTLLMDKASRSTNPANAAKAILHRARALVKPLETAERKLILCQSGSYRWNHEIGTQVDAEEFLSLCRKKEDEGALDRQMAALQLYRGDLLPKLSAHPWVAQQAQKVRELYEQTARQVMAQLEEQSRWDELAAVSQAALVQDPASEDFCRSRMTALLKTGHQQAAAAVYVLVSDQLYSRKSALPSEDIRKLYREALREMNPQASSFDELLSHLKEPEGERGALVCDYDFFEVLCRATARRMGRTGDCAHLVLVSAVNQEGGLPQRRSLDCVMDNLEGLFRQLLRRGDTVTRCSGSQYLLLLPGADFENSRMICGRIQRAFSRQYPHSPVNLQTFIRPVEPN